MLENFKSINSIEEIKSKKYEMNLRKLPEDYSEEVYQSAVDDLNQRKEEFNDSNEQEKVITINDKRYTIKIIRTKSIGNNETKEIGIIDEFDNYFMFLIQDMENIKGIMVTFDRKIFMVDLDMEFSKILRRIYKFLDKKTKKVEKQKKYQLA